jgi:hypothetical protein
MLAPSSVGVYLQESLRFATIKKTAFFDSEDNTSAGKHQLVAEVR